MEISLSDGREGPWFKGDISMLAPVGVCCCVSVERDIPVGMFIAAVLCVPVGASFVVVFLGILWLRG